MPGRRRPVPLPGNTIMRRGMVAAPCKGGNTLGIFSRMKDIMSSNINAVLDKMEDPSKMIDQMLRQSREDLAEVKQETAAVMANEKDAYRWWWR